MDILVNVVNQKLKVATNLKSLVSGTQQFSRFVFNLTDDWSDLTTFAQFTQNGVAYNQYLDDNNSVFLPSEIHEGLCTLMLYGSHENTIATTNYVTLVIDKNILVDDAGSTDISTSLYNQLVTRVNNLTGTSSSDYSTLQAADISLQAQINTKASQADLNEEIARAQEVEQAHATAIAAKASQSELDTRITAIQNWNTTNKANMDAVDADLQNQVNLKAASSALQSEILRATNAETTLTNSLLLKADQSDLDELASQVAELENNEYVATLISSAVASEIETYLSNGSLASLTITDGSISRSKLDTDVKASLTKADAAMPKATYDPQNIGLDVYTYAQARADVVQSNVDDVVDEISAAYQLTDTLVYTNLKDTIRGAVTLSRTYAQALLSDYKAFNVTVVDELPATGQERTFYLVPNNSGTGYDKYWWIIDDNDVAKWDVFGSSSTLIVTELPEVGDADADYILKSAQGCIYYKYIDNTWRVVAGSLAYIASSLPTVAQGNEYTDYYVISQETGKYVHYRFINGAYHSIGNSDSYTQTDLDDLLDSLDNALSNRITSNAQNISTNATNITSLNQTVNSLQQALTNLDVEGVTYFATYGTATLANGTQADNVFTLWEVEDGEETVKSQFVIQGGGGGGQQTITNLVVDRITQSPLIITPSDKAIISIDFSSTDSDGETVDGTYTWKNGNTTIMTGALVQGVNTFDLTDYSSIGTQKFTLVVVDEGGNTVVKTWTVQIVDVRLDSNFSDRITYPVGQSVNFSYTPYGSVSKTIHFILDGEELQSVTTSASGTLQSYTLSAQEHGAHLLECFATASINGIIVETSHIYKDIVWYDETADTPVISSIYRNDYPHIVDEPDVNYLQDYYILTEDGFEKAPFKLVESPIAADLSKYYELDGDEYVLTDDVGIVVNRNYYLKELDNSATYYSHKIYVMQYDTTSIPYYVFNPLTSMSEVTHSADGITSTQTLSVNADNWAYKTSVTGTHNLTISCGDASIVITLEVKHLDVNIEPVTANLAFDFNPVGLSNNSTDRLWHDANTDVAMTVSNNFDWSNGGYKLDEDGNQYFCIKSGTTATFDYNLFERDAKVYGSEFKIIFRTTNVKKADATFLNCVGDNVGLKMNTHEAYLYSTGGNLYMPYSEEDKIEFEFNINPLDQEDENATAIIMSYEDGVGMRPLIYDNSHRLNQMQNVKALTFGSEFCDVHIYRMKAYSSSLTDSNILANFIADAPDASEMIARYNRNQIYDENNNLTPEALAEACPDLRIIKIECPQFTNNKSNFVKYTNVQCIYKNGDPVLDNWTFTNAYHSGQGTTSNEYGYSGRNIDIICCMDGVNQYSSKITFDPNYTTTLTLGDGSKYYNGTGKVSLSRTSVPNNWFNIKVKYLPLYTVMYIA